MLRKRYLLKPPLAPFAPFPNPDSLKKIASSPLNFKLFTSMSSSSLLPSPLFTSAPPDRVKRPLVTLFDASGSGSPREMMAAEERLFEDEEVPPSPPRRLLDAFLQSAGKGRRSRSIGINATGSGSGTGTVVGGHEASSPITTAFGNSPVGKWKEEEVTPGMSIFLGLLRYRD